MANKSSKVYVIDPTESDSQNGRSGRRGNERTVYSPDSEGPQQAMRSRGHGRRRASVQVDEKGSPLLALVAYLAGPYAILATRRGRESRFWVALAILSCTGAAIVIARANSIFAGPHGAGAGYIIWLSVACLAALLGSAAWARGVILIGRHKGWLLRRLPAWLRHPGIAGAFGLVVPGFGLFAVGHARRAACAILTACAAAVAALVLWQSSPLWRLSRTGILVGHGDTLERIFLVMGAVGAFGALIWIVQALDGARLASVPADGAVRPHGDLAAAALVMAIMALLAAFSPARVAETLDRFAVSMQEDGLRVIPLAAAQAAMRLDPSKPEYAVQAIAMNETLGRPGEAHALRQDLAERWKPYERMLRLEAAAAQPVKPVVETLDAALFGPVKP
ncbi:MAG: hypothetical protein PHD74_08845 [Candidatus Krumholzibacteria bacterium]|nr:hypothetical protein [Candidatus Krumholzibacteria bacterium]